MKIVVNRCFGGFSLSPKAVERLAELNGRKAYHFKQDYSKGIESPRYIPYVEEMDSLFITSFDVPNPNNIEYRELWDNHHLTNRPKDRTNPLLIQVVEELGDEANGSCASLEIIDIPDDIDWEIDNYDGQETVHEKHKSW